MQPRLETVAMTLQADRIWRNITGNRTTLQPHQYPEPTAREEIRIEPRPVQAPVQASPRQNKPKEKSFEDQLEEMTQKYQQLSAHVFGEQRGYGREYPQQSFG